MTLTQEMIDEAISLINTPISIAERCPLAQMLRANGFLEGTVGITKYFLQPIKKIEDEETGFPLTGKMFDLATHFTYREYDQIKPCKLKVRVE